MIEIAFVDRAESSPDLMEMLPGGVHTEWSLKGEMPRAIFSFQDTNNVGSPIDGGSVSVDIFTRGNDVEGIVRIAKKFIDLFDRFLTYTEDAGNTVRFYYANGGFQNEPDPQFTHYSINFNVRYLRG